MDEDTIIHVSSTAHLRDQGMDDPDESSNKCDPVSIAPTEFQSQATPIKDDLIILDGSDRLMYDWVDLLRLRKYPQKIRILSSSGYSVVTVATISSTMNNYQELLHYYSFQLDYWQPRPSERVTEAVPTGHTSIRLSSIFKIGYPEPLQWVAIFRGKDRGGNFLYKPIKAYSKDSCFDHIMNMAVMGFSVVYQYAIVEKPKKVAAKELVGMHLQCSIIGKEFVVY